MTCSHVFPLGLMILGSSAMSADIPAQEEDFSVPIRPGVPGGAAILECPYQAFHLGSTFEFPEVPAATGYRFDLVMREGKEEFSFEAAKPWTPLSPIWNSLPEGQIEPTVVALGGCRMGWWSGSGSS